jgi:hypothetical protein
MPLGRPATPTVNIRSGPKARDPDARRGAEGFVRIQRPSPYGRRYCWQGETCDSASGTPRSCPSLEDMSTDAEISTGAQRLRKRTRYFVNEALRLRTSDLAPLLKGHLNSMRVRWRAIDHTFTVARDEGCIVITGSPAPTRVALTVVTGGRAGKRVMFTCGCCARACSHLFLPPGHSTFGCVRCRRIRYRERAGPSPLARLRAEWAHIGEQVDAVEAAQRLGLRPDVGGQEVDVRFLRRRLRQLQAELRAAAPPGVLQA